MTACGPELEQQVPVRLEAGISFVPTDQVQAGLDKAGVPRAEASAIVDSYSAARLEGLKLGLLAAAGIALGSFWFTRRLPGERQGAGTLPQAGTAGPAPPRQRPGQAVPRQ